MPTNPIDFEKYAQALHQTMADAVAEAESLAALAAMDRDAIADVRVTKQGKLNDLDQQARRVATDYVLENSQQIKKNIRENILALVAAKMLKSGQEVTSIAAMLEVSEDFVKQAENHCIN
ncbi:MAG: hypothetical protein ABIQ93_01755 [Saprospiraceae bacterium]